MLPIVLAPSRGRIHPESAPELATANTPGANAGADGDDSSVPAIELAQIKRLLTMMAAERRARERDEIVLDRQRQAFDFMMKQRAELERERNALMALAMEQRKHDDELLKEWIRLI